MVWNITHYASRFTLLRAGRDGGCDPWRGAGRAHRRQSPADIEYDQHQDQQDDDDQDNRRRVGPLIARRAAVHLAHAPLLRVTCHSERNEESAFPSWIVLG